MPATAQAPEVTRRTTVSEVRDLATIPLWSHSEPNAAGLIGVGRSHVYVLAQRGDLPTVHLGRRILVKVADLLHLLGIDG